MENNWKTHLDRWRKEGLIDDFTFQRIVAFEAEQEPSRTSRIGVVLAIVLGVVLSTLSVFLFIAAHWDHLSPAYRMLVILATLLLVHSIGAFTAKTFPALSQGMHALGSLALGGAIFLTAQTFNLEEHWPNGILLWALGTLAGWFLLRHWSQLLLLAILGPWWVAGEFMERFNEQDMNAILPTIFLAGLAISYLTAPRKDESEGSPLQPVWRGLRGIGVVVLYPTWIILFETARGGYRDFTTSPYSFLWIVFAACIPVAVAALWRRERALWNLGFAALSVVSTYLLHRTDRTGFFGDYEAEIAVLAGVTSLLFAAWGMKERDITRLNLGVVGVALSALVFYFTTMFDKLERSLSLLLLGIIFLVGGWGLEKARRKLIAQMQKPGGVA